MTLTAGERLEMLEFEFEGEVIRWKSWHLITVPPELAVEINRFSAGLKSGWGSIKVDVSVGDTRWRTSLFPDKERDSFVLPAKAAVRAAENFGEGDTVAVTIRL